MATNKRTDKGFCPFCGMSFSGDHDDCPFCGQDLRMYKDDLGPIMGSIQTATNIDMKSPKVRITMSVVLFLLAFAGALVVFDYYDSHFNTPAEEAEIVIPEGLMIELQSNGYLDLTQDFATQDIKVQPLYDPELKLRFYLGDGHQNKYQKVVWQVTTESYSSTNMKNPFYQKVTKDISEYSDIDSVIWENVNIGKFWIIADCYTADGECEVFMGAGVYYGKLVKSYSWTYNGAKMSFDYTMSSDEVRKCLNVDLTTRMDQQSVSSMTDYVIDGQSITDLDNKLKSLYNKSYRYSEAGYADFVLSFVQSCIYDVYDSYNYHVSDFWAYPAETILNGCGDDEDRAILFCSIMKDAGMNVGIITFPESTIAAVEVDLSDSYIGTYAKTIRELYNRYTVADTDSELGLGELKSYYDVSEDGTLYYNGTEIHGKYRLETV